MTVNHGGGDTKTYPTYATSFTTNNYGPFNPETGSDICGGDSIIDIPTCNSCGQYYCCKGSFVGYSNNLNSKNC
jgi:hypothetical protein